MRGRRLAGASILILLAACSLAEPAGSIAPAGSAEGASECSPIDIRGPSGAPVELTGVWRSNDLGIYTIRQIGSCVYWLGMSQYSGEEPGTSWTDVFTGTMRSDLTIVGTWADVPYSPAGFLGDGTLTLRIGFVQSGEAERPTLGFVSSSSEYGASAWVLEESLVPVELDGVFGGNADHLLETGCVWIESGGQRYELIGDGGWDIRIDPPLRVEDPAGRVVARVGDSLRIRGGASEALGTNCVENAILIEELDPTP
jgi:hypothetical protein